MGMAYLSSNRIWTSDVVFSARRGSSHLLTGSAKHFVYGGLLLRFACVLHVRCMYDMCYIYIMGLTMGCTSKIAIGIRKGCKRMINLGNLSLLDKSILYSLPHDHLKHVLVMYIGCPSCLPLCKAHLSFGQISVLSPFNIIQSCSIPQIVSK
jgi:hypothetical protein